MADQRSEELIRKIYDTFNSRDLDQLDQYMHPDYEDHSVGVPFPTPFNLQTLKDFLQMYFAAFPDGQFSLSDVISEGFGDGDRVAWRDHFTGTNTGDFMGMPATGRKVATEGMSMGEIRDGKAYRHWSVYDNLGMMQQLGIIPMPGEQPVAAQ